MHVVIKLLLLFIISDASNFARRLRRFLPHPSRLTMKLMAVKRGRQNGVFTFYNKLGRYFYCATRSYGN